MRGDNIVTLALAALVAVGVGVAVAATRPTGSPAAAPLPASALAQVGPTAASAGQSRPRPLPAPGQSIAGPSPHRQTDLAASSIRIPALDVTATIGRATVDNGVLVPPGIPDEVGWWPGSSELDATAGEVTLVGHVNWAGMPAFAFGRLAYLHPGDLVYTTDAHATQTPWRISRVTARSKQVGIDPAAFAGPAGPRRLVLITCGGPYESSTRSYADNVYAYADPA